MIHCYCSMFTGKQVSKIFNEFLSNLTFSINFYFSYSIYCDLFQKRILYLPIMLSFLVTKLCSFLAFLDGRILSELYVILSWGRWLYSLKPYYFNKILKLPKLSCFQFFYPLSKGISSGRDLFSLSHLPSVRIKMTAFL